MTLDDPAVTMLACYEGASHDGAHSPFHLLSSSSTSEAELWAFLVALCEYGSDAKSPRDPPDAMRILAKRSNQILAGGVVIKTQDVLIVPGCCCGLEDWIGMKGIRQGSLTPWLGHDPTPWIDTSGPKAILHSDEGEDGDTIAIDYADLDKGIQVASRELAQFVSSLTTWLGQSDAGQAQLIGGKIATWFHLDRET